MLSSALAYFLSLILTIVLGGLLTFLVKAILALVIFALIAIFYADNKPKTYSNESPQVLTIEFLSNIFYGYMANSIGIWVFRYMEIAIDWFYPVFMLCAFIWFDLTRMRNETERIQQLDNQIPRDRIPADLFPNGIPENMGKLSELEKANMVNVFKNLRLTALFGKIAGVVIGGLQLIIRAN